MERRRHKIIEMIDTIWNSAQTAITFDNIIHSFQRALMEISSAERVHTSLEEDKEIDPNNLTPDLFVWPPDEASVPDLIDEEESKSNHSIMNYK